MTVNRRNFSYNLYCIFVAAKAETKIEWYNLTTWNMFDAAALCKKENQDTA